MIPPEAPVLVCLTMMLGVTLLWSGGEIVAGAWVATRGFPGPARRRLRVGVVGVAVCVLAALAWVVAVYPRMS